MRKFSALWLVIGTLTGLVLTGCHTMAPHNVSEKVVYHVNDSDNATAALRNVGNHLDVTEGKATIVVVTHAKGIDFLLDGAQDKNGNPYNIPVEKLKARGVDFRVCAITLKSRSIDPKTVIPEATIVPSGVAEIGKLQTHEGFVYLKP